MPTDSPHARVLAGKDKRRTAHSSHNERSQPSRLQRLGRSRASPDRLILSVRRARTSRDGDSRWSPHRECSAHVELSPEQGTARHGSRRNGCAVPNTSLQQSYLGARPSLDPSDCPGHGMADRLGLASCGAMPSATSLPRTRVGSPGNAEKCSKGRRGSVPSERGCYQEASAAREFGSVDLDTIAGSPKWKPCR